MLTEPNDSSAATLTAERPPSAEPSELSERADHLRILQDVLVHEEIGAGDTGWRAYATPRFLGWSVLAAYGLTVFSVAVAHVLRGGAHEGIVLLRPIGAILTAPMGMMGLWMGLSSDQDGVVAQHRTWRGRLAAFGISYLLMHAAAWIFYWGLLSIFRTGA